jgi:hypothetical protein
MKRVFPAVAVAAILAAIALLPVHAGDEKAAPKVYRAWTKAELVDAASIHCSRITKERQCYIRYVDLSAIAPDRRLDYVRVLALAVNSWSRYDKLQLIKAVPDTDLALAYFDLSLMRDPEDEKGLEQLVKAFDDLGAKGSGPSPFPEPFFHAVIQTKDKVVAVEGKTESYDEWVTRTDGRGGTYVVWDARQGRYVPELVKVTRTREVKGYTETVKGVTKVALASHLNKATAAGLALLTKSDFPIFEVRWLIYNGLVEPRYHELLGLDDTEASAKKLAAVDEKLSDKVGSKLRGAVLFSEVAHHNRLLERTPSQHRSGRGSYWESYDFKTSVDLQDVLKDTLNDKPDAKEVIFTLPNGLNGYFVVDGNGKRLDKADGDVANNKRSKFRDTQVRAAYHCMACHFADRGYIPVDDEVRALSKKTITLVVDAYDKSRSKAERSRSEKIRRLYLEDDINDLLALDQLVLDVALRKVTTGLKTDEAGKLIADTIYEYTELPVNIATLARELGYSSEAVEKAVRVGGVDPVFVSIAAGRLGRRDQVERGFNQIATLLYKAATKE